MSENSNPQWNYAGGSGPAPNPYLTAPAAGQGYSSTAPQSMAGTASPGPQAAQAPGRFPPPGTQPGQAAGAAPQFPPVQSPPGPQFPAPSGPGSPPGQPQYAGQLGMPPDRPPSGPRTPKGPWIAAAIVVAVVAIGVAAVLIWFTGSDSDAPQAQDTATSAPADTDSQAEPPSEEPSTETVPPEDRYSEADFPQDWDTSFGADDLTATRAGGWDYADCAELDTGGTFTGQGCQYAIEYALSNDAGDVIATTFVLAMSDDDVAFALTEEDHTVDGLAYHDESLVPNADQTLYESRSVDNLYLLTVLTATDDLRAEAAESFAFDANMDAYSAIVLG